MKWKEGQLIELESDSSLGVAVVKELNLPDSILIKFLKSNLERNYSARNPPFKRFILRENSKVKIESKWVSVYEVKEKAGLLEFRSEAGLFLESQIEEVEESNHLLDVISRRRQTAIKEFPLRNEVKKALSFRQGHFFRGATGCRVNLLFHQFGIVNSCLHQLSVGPLKVLLCDEVGLGKTIEAGLIFSALHARGELKRVLILAPEALKVQWLTECFRRFNVRFRLDHEDLIEDFEFRDFVISSHIPSSRLAGGEPTESNELIDLLIVDEAHKWNLDLLGEFAKSQCRHKLFLTATPSLGGIKTLQKMSEILEGPQLFSSKRSELGLPWYRQLEASFVENKKEWLFEFLQDIRQNQPQRKISVLVSSPEQVISLGRSLRDLIGENFAVFHENMNLVERDRSAAYFANPEGAQFFISSEIGGEGRNFQFCSDLVLMDIPQDPLVLEQRIGRLDRIGQTKKVKVWVPIESKEDETVFEKMRDEFKVFDQPYTGPGGLTHDTSGFDLKKIDLDKSNKNQILGNVSSLSSYEIKKSFEKICDTFGVEVEDYDADENLKISASSLMFVDYFPGLGSDGERVLTFDRSKALEREEMSYFSLDHPDLIEAFEFFLQRGRGVFSVAKCEQILDQFCEIWIAYEDNSLKKFTANTRGEWSASNLELGEIDSYLVKNAPSDSKNEQELIVGQKLAFRLFEWIKSVQTNKMKNLDIDSVAVILNEKILNA